MENDSADQHAVILRQWIRDVYGDRAGVLGSADLLVTQNGGGNLTVDVGAGSAVWDGTEAANQGFYYAFNDGTVNLALSTPDPANPRNDIVIVKARDAFYSGANNDGQLIIVAGTPAGSPADPDLDALGHENYFRLARLRVQAADTQILTAEIDDLRQRTFAIGSVIICTSGTRPTLTAGDEGIEIYETDTKERLHWNGTAWLYISSHMRKISGTGTTLTTSYVSQIGTLTLPHGAWTLDGFIRGSFSVAGRRTFSAQIWNSSDSASVLELDEGVDDATSNNPHVIYLHSDQTLLSTKNFQVRAKTDSTGGTQFCGTGYLRATRVREVI
jgi:hypothetical protein